MSPLLTSTALGLVAALPASGLGWLIGATADRLTGHPRTRTAAWSGAVALPPTMLALVVGVAALPKAATATVYEVAQASPVIAAAGAAMNAASTRALSGFDGLEVMSAALAAGALGGLAMAVARQAVGRAKLRGVVARARPASRDLALAVAAAARRMDTAWPEVRISDDIDQPLLAGLSEPVILLPSDLAEQLDADQLAPICAHELAHLKRGDNWRLLFEHLVGGALWMIPLYAVLRARAAAAREELADALALEDAPPALRQRYAETLIDVLRARAATTLHPAFTGKGRKSIAMRLKAIINPSAPANLARRAVLALVAMLAVTTAATASIALAHQGDGGGKPSSRSVISDEKGLYVDIRSDFVRVTNAELIGGELKPEDGQVWVYHGDVQVRGRLNSPQIRMLLNGGAPPPGFDPVALPKGAVQELQVTHYNRDATPTMVLNFITKTP